MNPISNFKWTCKLQVCLCYWYLVHTVTHIQRTDTGNVCKLHLCCGPIYLCTLYYTYKQGLASTFYFNFLSKTYHSGSLWQPVSFA